MLTQPVIANLEELIGGSKVISISHATFEDAEDILALQKLAYQSEAVLYNDWSIPPLTQTIESLHDEFANSVMLKATVGDRIVGSVRAKIGGNICAVGRLIVHPEFQGKGIGSRLLQTIEGSCNNVAKFELFTGSKSENNIRLYQRAGYRITRTQLLSPTVSITFLEKPANATLTQHPNSLIIPSLTFPLPLPREVSGSSSLQGGGWDGSISASMPANLSQQAILIPITS